MTITSIGDSLTRPDVALIRPRDLAAVPPDAPVQDPLGVGYLSAVLRKRGYEVVVLDAHALGIDDNGLIRCLQELCPRIVGLSLHSFSDYDHCVAISRSLRSLTEPPYCVWGGEHATFHAERILSQHAEVDAVVLGEGEETFPALIAQVLSKGPAVEDTRSSAKDHAVHPLPVLSAGACSSVAIEEHVAGIRGAVTRSANGEPINGGFRPAIPSLDGLPEPHKDVVEMALRMGKPVSVSVLTGRGCTHRCRFCTAHDFLRLGGGSVWRRRSPSAVVEEVSRLAKAYLGHSLVHPVLQFQDVIFLGTSRAAIRWVEDFLDELERRAIRVPFYCMARADSIIANRQLLPRLARNGLWSVEVGIESGVDRILQSYNKLNSAGDNELAVSLLKENGITYDASGFIMFDPLMTLRELKENARYLARFGAATWDFFVTRLQLYPGTELREEMIAKGLFDGADDIGRTSGYRFQDPQVGLVADHAYYYDLSIRELDLRLRDAKAILAGHIRQQEPTNQPLADAVNLVHKIYCEHLLTLTHLVELDMLHQGFEELKKSFLGKVSILTYLLNELLTASKPTARDR